MHSLIPIISFQKKILERPVKKLCNDFLAKRDITDTTNINLGSNHYQYCTPFNRLLSLYLLIRFHFFKRTIIIGSTIYTTISSFTPASPFTIRLCCWIATALII